ncbi:hypothetical protein CEAn_00636 [Coxiella endosymbiont of Amblyomma nuttalli]|nr:hypothetical protein CEAn_00636 [Coxiella endosymbiont of Amblyomma nuttalli]
MDINKHKIFNLSFILPFTIRWFFIVVVCTYVYLLIAKAYDIENIDCEGL